MFQTDPLAERASAILFQNVEQHLEALLAEHGAQDPSELPRPLQLQLLETAMIGAAATTFPTGNLEMLQHGFRSVTHPALLSAMDRMMVSCRSAGDAFEMVRGVHAAIVLAGIQTRRAARSRFYAGWQVNGKPYGAPNEGYVPVPGQLLRAVVNDPRVAYWFWRNPGASKAIH